MHAARTRTPALTLIPGGRQGPAVLRRRSTGTRRAALPGPPSGFAFVFALSDVVHALRGLPPADAARVIELARHCLDSLNGAS